MNGGEALRACCSCYINIPQWNLSFCIHTFMLSLHTLSLVWPCEFLWLLRHQKMWCKQKIKRCLSLVGTRRGGLPSSCSAEISMLRNPSKPLRGRDQQWAILLKPSRQTSSQMIFQLMPAACMTLDKTKRTTQLTWAQIADSQNCEQIKWFLY